jgi:hypothetical protein
MASIILVASLLTGDSGPKRPADSTSSHGEVTTTFAFSATVRSVQPLSQFEGEAVLSDFDPMFILTLDIANVTPGDDTIKPGGRVSIAIHSPAKLFALDRTAEYMGRVFEFSIDRHTNKNGVRWSNLKTKK